MPFTLDALTGIPDYARLDLAWQETISFPGFSPVTGAQHKPRAGEIDIVTNIMLHYAANATVATRVNVVSIADQDGNLVLVSAASLTVAADTAAWWNWNIAFTVSATSVIQTDLEPLPVFSLLSGWALNIAITNGVAGDLIDHATLNVLHIPTGPAIEQQKQSTFPTPILI